MPVFTITWLHGLFLHIPDDGLPTVVHMHVLDANVLISTVARICGKNLGQSACARCAAISAVRAPLSPHTIGMWRRTFITA
jgi:hypothetical protein